MYVLNCTAPNDCKNWVFPVGYFPHKYKYLKHAKRMGYELAKDGATNITITYPNNNIKNLKIK